MNPPRISMLRLVAVVAILGLLLLGPPGAMADPIFATVLGTKRVSDIPGFAPVLDPNLVNPIGITASAGSPDWVANNGSGVASSYGVNGDFGVAIIGKDGNLDYVTEKVQAGERVRDVVINNFDPQFEGRKQYK